MRKLHGFSAVITNLDWVVETDNYSVHRYEDDKYIILVQHPCEESLYSLRDQINKNKDFIPNRHTDGSFLVINKKNRTVMAGRDRSAASHLYFYSNNGTYYISTDNCFILNQCKTLDAAALDLTILRKNKVFTPFPLIKGCKAIQPGHYLMIDSKGVMESVFWSINTREVPNEYKDAVSQYGELLKESIRTSINSDNVGVYLSGGSDSAAVMGCLHSLGVKNVKAVHMSYPGNFEFEDKDCEALRNVYNFDLQYVTGGRRDWENSVKKRILNSSINSLGLTLPTYLMMGEALGLALPAGATVMNGELCLLDVGQTTTNDRTRGYRRWLYRQSGRNLARMPHILPSKCNVNWDKHTHYDYSYFSRKDKWRFAFELFHSILYSIGRPAHYFMGNEIGIMGLPGPNLVLSLLPKEYVSHRYERFYDFFLQYEEGLKNKTSFDGTMNTMLCSWYSEMENFTMANDAAAAGHLSMVFPFSSVELMDFAASLPIEWSMDKKIQKDCCIECFNMPEEVAYRKKDHSRTVPYASIVYPFFKEKEKEIRNYVLDTEWGPLNEGVKTLIRTLDITSYKFYAIWALSLWINEYNLKVE